ncbi:MAG: hypothetical protein JSV04_09050 [Candidatus Heimdallarchaeota archaeon]|nr:MAG: hypothetical protein JSV04_09050 [Candidatus Heimdallarchaeota archaeon]
MESNIYVLDATAFIGLDFPHLQMIPNSKFYTSLKVESELKDFRSRTNMDILKHSGRLQICNPEESLLKDLKRRIQAIDPKTPLSSVDLDILTLALQLKGTLISNDLNLQNAALYLRIPVKIISGKKITHLRKWQLKCLSCGKIDEKGIRICPSCGGDMKRVQIYPNNKKLE